MFDDVAVRVVGKDLDLCAEVECLGKVPVEEQAYRPGVVVVRGGVPQVGDDRGIDELAGTWETASQGYEYFDTPQAEYYVRFMDSEIVYGHMQDDEFVFDHSDKIVDQEEMAEGRYKVKAETANGGQYTYMTSESGNDLLFYYMTWDEDEFPDQLSGSSSIGRISSEPSAGETIVIPIPASVGLVEAP